MQISSASRFSVLETSTKDDGGHCFNSFNFYVLETVQEEDEKMQILSAS